MSPTFLTFQKVLAHIDRDIAAHPGSCQGNKGSVDPASETGSNIAVIQFFDLEEIPGQCDKVTALHGGVEMAAAPTPRRL